MPMVLPAPNPLDVALQHHRSGRLAEAEALYRQILAAQPNHAGALHLLGVLCGQTNRAAVGVDLITRACAISPQIALPWVHLGDLLRQVGKPDKAALAYKRGIQIDPSSVEAHNNLGNAMVDQLKYAEAAEAYRIAVRLDPRNDKAYSNLGVVLKELGEFGQALAALKRAVEINANSVIAYDNLGLVLRDDGQIDASIAAHLRAVQLDPSSSGACNNLSVALRAAERYDESVAASRKAIALNPATADAFSNLGVTLALLGRVDEAIAAYRKSLELRPAFQEAWTNLGNALADKCEFAGALAACQKAVDINPSSPIAHFNLGLVLLALGDFERGWVEYEWRWQIHGLYLPRPFTQPRWDGRPLKGKTILLHADQGYGDTIQFMRYVAMVVQGGGRVVLGCDKPLKPLFEGSPGISHVFTDHEAVPPFDVHLPVASLGAVFNSTAATIPATVPYIQARPQLIEAWRQKLAPFDGRLKVGLAWQGRMSNPQQRKRAVAFSQLAALSKAKGVRFFSLQKGDAAAQANDRSPEMDFVDFSADLHDFAETAALMTHLDFVISIDTGVAHLAGAMGKPVWTLIPFKPDWRWLLDRQDSPWYPTMRLFRQTRPDDWTDAISNLCECFIELMEKRR